MALTAEDLEDACIRCLRRGTSLTSAGVCADTGACELVQPAIFAAADMPNLGLALWPPPPEAA